MRQNSVLASFGRILSDISFLFFGNGVSRKNAFEIYWPLVSTCFYLINYFFPSSLMKFILCLGLVSGNFINLHPLFCTKAKKYLVSNFLLEPISYLKLQIRNPQEDHRKQGKNRIMKNLLTWKKFGFKSLK